jgi:hypothetical protein
MLALHCRCTLCGSVRSMTRPAEGGKHSDDAQCVGFDVRFPKWNPRYVAYALTHGATDIGEFREQQANNAGFVAWIAEQRETWRVARRIASPHLTRAQEQDFSRWLESRCEQPTHVSTGCLLVMAELTSERAST